MSVGIIEADNSKARPFLKWAGGKRQLIPQLLEHIPSDFPREGATYFEPFAGGAAFYFALREKLGHTFNAVLGDFNERLVRTYRAVRDAPEAVINRLRLHAAYHSQEYFLELRTIDVDADDDTDVAAWMIYLNKTCFNGLYRVNRKGQFNVPFGKYNNPNICDSENLRACSATLKWDTIHEADFGVLQTGVLGIPRPRAGDLVYFDPPYVPLSATSSFTNYTSDGFGLTDQVRLRDLFVELKDRGVHVILSNSSAPTVYELYAEHRITEVQTKRAVNSKGTGRGSVKELIIT